MSIEQGSWLVLPRELVLCWREPGSRLSAAQWARYGGSLPCLWGTIVVAFPGGLFFRGRVLNDDLMASHPTS